MAATTGSGARDSLAQALQKGMDQLLPEIVKRAFDRGLESSSAPAPTERSFGELIPGVRLSRDLARLIYGQIDETKKAVVRTVATEFKDFLTATDLSSELLRALTSLSLELKTEVRFIPNDKGSGVHPSFEVHAIRTRTRTPRRRSRGRAHAPGSGESGGGGTRTPRRAATRRS